MLAICLITYGAIAYLTPISYTAILEDELRRESIALVSRLEESTANDCTGILDDFVRQFGADMQLTYENGREIYTTFSQANPAEVIPMPTMQAFTAVPSEDTGSSAQTDIVQEAGQGESAVMGIASEASFEMIEGTLVQGASSESSVQATVPEATGSQGITIADGSAISDDDVYLVEQVTVVEGRIGHNGIYDFAFSDGAYASLYVQGGRRAVNQASQAMEQLLPFLILVVLAISLLGSFFYARLITRPIVSLSHIAKRMAGLDFDASWDKKRADEIGVLGDSLNLLSGNLSGALTDLKAANEALRDDIERERELEHQRLTFFSAASHELKTPVTILKGQLSGMLAQVGIYKDREKYLARALEVTCQMEGLIKETLTISRIESGSFVLTADAVNLSELMNNQLSLVEDLLAQKEITLGTDIDPDVVIRGNEALMASVLDNLLMNAILYSPQGAAITVDVHRGRLSVENSGVFIPTEALPELFTPFYRVEQSRNRKSGGSGLGLYIVQSILKLHGATCKAINTSQGVRFYAEFSGENA